MMDTIERLPVSVQQVFGHAVLIACDRYDAVMIVSRTEAEEIARQLAEVLA
jgi:hypothetical protein